MMINYRLFKNITSLIVVSLIIVSCTCKSPDKVNILAIGDSIVEGHPGYHSEIHGGPLGNSDSQIWHHMIAELGGGYSYFNAGLSRDTIDNVSGRIDPLLESKSPDMVYLHVGINDVIDGLALTHYISKLEVILKKVEKAGAELIVGEILPWTAGSDLQQETIKLWNAQIRQWCLEKSIKMAYIYQGVVSMSPERRDDDINKEFDLDGVHYTAEGYGFLGKLYARAAVPTRDLVWGESDRLNAGPWIWFMKSDGVSFKGDPYYGAVILPQGETVDSPVLSLERGDKKIQITPKTDGSVEIYYRISKNNFQRLTGKVKWKLYEGEFAASEQFIQVRLRGGFNTPTKIDTLKLSWSVKGVI